jgi:hypothetical protein
VDKDTFARFTEFIYKDNYNVAEALIIFNNLDIKRRRFESDFSRLLEVEVADSLFLIVDLFDF